MSEYCYGSHPTEYKKNGKKKSILIHRRVWVQHHGEIPQGHIIHHINGDKKDNRLKNLECISYSEHRFKHPESGKKIKLSV